MATIRFGILVPDLSDILEKAGYNCSMIDEERWANYNIYFEYECNNFTEDEINEEKHLDISAWIKNLNLKKNEKTKNICNR